MNETKKDFALNIFLLVHGICCLLIYCFIESNVLLFLIGVLVLIVGVKSWENTYSDYYIENRKSNWRYKDLTDEELEIIEDAKNLIRSVDKNIVIADFSVYKIYFSRKGRFYYDEATQELCIFIPFRILKILGGKDLCFLAVVHEVLHSQNLRENLCIFKKDFLEGLNQLLTVWLIENYSRKYKNPKERKKIASVELKNKTVELFRKGFVAYPKEVEMVQEILNNSQVNMMELFLNYIDLKPEFFEELVPSKYLEKQ